MNDQRQNQEAPLPQAPETEQPAEQQRGGRVGPEVTADEMEELFTEQEAPQPQQRQAPAAAEVTLRKQRTWGSKDLQELRDLLTANPALSDQVAQLMDQYSS